MPQIAQLADTFAGQVFWSLLFFGFIFFVIGRGMVPKVMATVESRDRQIARDLAAAQAARTSAEAEEEAWRVQENAQRAEAQAQLAHAKADAAKASEARLAKANAELDVKLGEAEARIAKARANALGEIETVAVEAAGDIVQRVAGLKADLGATRAAVKVALHG